MGLLCLSLNLPSAKKINKDQWDTISPQLEPGKSKGEKSWSGFSSSHPLLCLILSAARLLQSWFCFALQSRACLSDLVFLSPLCKAAQGGLRGSAVHMKEASATESIGKPSAPTDEDVSMVLYKKGTLLLSFSFFFSFSSCEEAIHVHRQPCQKCGVYQRCVPPTAMGQSLVEG